MYYACFFIWNLSSRKYGLTKAPAAVFLFIISFTLGGAVVGLLGEA